MKKFLIVAISFLWMAGFTSMAWAHSPKRSGHVFHSHGHSKPHFSRHSHKGKHLGHGQGFRTHRPSKHHLGKRSHFRKHLGQRQGFRRLGPRRFQRFYRYYSPTLRNNDYEERAPREESRPAPKHSAASHIYYDTNPEPWFLYGKSKEFRQMGLIPPLQ